MHFPNEVLNIIYIVSPNFSGSTLLSCLLELHPGISTLGERNKFWRKMFNDNMAGSQICSCGKSFKNCDYWMELKLYIETEFPSDLWQMDFCNFYLYPNYYLGRLSVNLCRSFAARNTINRIPWPIRKRFHQVLNENISLIQYVLKREKSTYFLDSSKNPYHVIFLNAHPQARVKVIQLFRDGRGYLYSSLKRNPQRSVSEICQEWGRIIRRNQKILETWGGDLLNIKYETFCSAPEQNLKNILKFLYLDSSNLAINFSTDRMHIMGNNEMRLVKFSGIRNDEAWRRHLTKEQLEEFEITVGHLNCEIGY